MDKSMRISQILESHRMKVDELANFRYLRKTSSSKDVGGLADSANASAFMNERNFAFVPRVSQQKLLAVGGKGGSPPKEPTSRTNFFVSGFFICRSLIFIWEWNF